ncbi:MAG: hypothetical protein LC781_15255 [Actinobacteria bacterium]|nr:hypothetical protein [Actinomycetota bacterium]
MASSHASARVVVGIGIFLLALGTAAIHLYLGLSFGNMLFVLNGLGYLGLLAALQLPIPQLARFRPIARWALAGYTALTIVLYFIDNPGMTIGYVDKAIEVALIALLLADAYRARAEPSGEVPGPRTTAL